MTGIQTVLDSDRIINKYRWNAVLVRDGKYWSVNHYKACRSQDTGSYLPERVEIRYELTKERDFGDFHMKCPVQ